MLKRVINLPLVSLVCLSFLPMYACSSGGNDDSQFTFGSFSTTQTTFNMTADTMMEAEESGDTTAGDGDGDTTPGDGDGDGDTTPGDGDGDDGDGDPSAGDGDGDADTDCPVGEFGCPCDNGECVPGLTCDQGTCGLGGGDGDGDGDPTGDGDGDPWDPNTCMEPSIPVTINGLTGDVCSPPCSVDADCPPGPVGTNPQCALILDMAMDPSNCALVCDPVNDGCPVGASCKEIVDQPGVGICTYP
jgi:hypothetical protein